MSTWTGNIDGNMDNEDNWDSGIPYGTATIYSSPNPPSSGTCYADTVNNYNYINGGYFQHCDVYNYGSINSGIFEGYVQNNGFIGWDSGYGDGPVFNNIVESYGAIGISNSAIFNNVLKLYNDSYTYNCVCNDLDMQGGEIDGGIFNGSCTISGGEVVGGIFNGDVVCGSIISDGVFNGSFIVSGYGEINGGIFNGEVVSHMTFGPGFSNGVFNGTFTWGDQYMVILSAIDFTNLKKIKLGGSKMFNREKGINKSGILGMI